MSSNFPKSYDKKQKKLVSAFNVSDFRNNYDSATIEDLSDYANLNEINVFSKLTYFQSILVVSINSVSNQVLDFLAGITQDVQIAFNTIFTNLTTLNDKTVNIYYDSVNDITEFKNYNMFERLAIYENATFACPTSISNTLKVSKISSFDILCNNINCVSEMTVNSLKIKNRPIYNYGSIIYFSNLSFPVQNTFNLPNNLTSSLLYFTLNPKHQIYIYLNSSSVYYFDNDTNDIIYYKNSFITNFDKVIITFSYLEI